MTIPATCCGAVDVGYSEPRGLILIEAHHPYAIGWYGEDARVYFEYLQQGWKYMVALNA